MPLPLTTFFRSPSLGQGGTTKCNLRGSTLYDYANSTADWTSTNPLTTVSVSGKQWSLLLPKAFDLTTVDTLTRGSLLSTATTNFTVMFRFYAPSSIANPGPMGSTVFFNGTPGFGPGFAFWGIGINGVDPSTARFQFFSTSGGSLNPTQNISSTPLVANTWYHVAVTVEEGDPDDTLLGFINGVRTLQTSVAKLDTPAGATKIGLINSQQQNFYITDIVFLEKVLTSDEIRAYAISPFV